MREVVQCCIVGGGPAGMMAGVLLARQGVDVLVVEKHQDFLRDFRGDTIHPSTLELMHELGWATELLDRQHTKMTEVTVSMDGTAVTFADFRKLRVHHPFIAFMPQWDFLDFLAAKGDALANFRLLRSTQMTELLVEKDRVAGILASSENGEVEIRADLVVAADGRHSVARAKAGLRSIAKSAPLDVLWFRLPRQPGDDIPFFQGGRGVLISINRGDYWQLAYAIPTDAYDQLRRDGLSGFRTRIAELVPRLADRLGQIHSWDDVHHLSVRVDRLRRWYRPGLLCIGDAAHAMSPAGGVGINLAVQDAVATANLVGPVLTRTSPSDRDLRRVQRRRSLPAAVTQTFQTAILRDLYPKNLDDDTTHHVPPVVRLFRFLPALRYVVGRFIGLGVRPEHIRQLAESRRYR